MRYFMLIIGIILVAVAALFLIKDNDALLLLAIVTVIGSFWVAVFQIPKESDS